MQLEWLEDFIELARTRSLSRAAENRFVTHPAFGRRIRALEEWVGVALIERKQPVSLTAAGLLFLDTATHAVDLLNGARDQFQSLNFTADDPVRLVTGRTLAVDFFPDWYATLQNRFGDFSVSVVTCGAQEAIMHMSAGDADLLLTFTSPLTQVLIDPHRFDSLVLAQERLVLVSAPNADGTPIFPMSTGDRAATPWLAVAPVLSTRSLLAQHLAKLRHKPALRMIYQADSYSAICEMAKRGIGVAWLPQMVVRDALQIGALVVTGAPALQVDFDIGLHRLHTCVHPRVLKIWAGLKVDEAPNSSK